MENERMLFEEVQDAVKPRLKRILRYSSELLSFMSAIDFETYKANNQLKYAATFLLLQLGNLANRLPGEIKAQIIVPWSAIMAARNATMNGHSLSHQEIIYNDIKKKMPDLYRSVEEVIIVPRGTIIMGRFERKELS